MVQNLTCSGEYLRSTLSYAILWKVLKLVPLTEAGHELYVAITTTVFTSSYTSLEDDLNHLKFFKLKDHLGENVSE